MKKKFNLSAKQRGSFAIEGAIVFSVLTMTLIVLITFLFAWYREQQNYQAARAAAQKASVVFPVADLYGLSPGASISCYLQYGSVACSSGYISHPSNFFDIVDAAQTIDSHVNANNLTITYTMTSASRHHHHGIKIALITITLQSGNYYSLVAGLGGVSSPIARVTALQRAFGSGGPA